MWIGTEAMIMPGITIGDGALIGSKALVTKDVEPYNIVGGNPAKIIKKRFSDEHIDKLMDMQWWNWHEKLLSLAIPLLCTNNIDALYDFYKR